MPIKGLIQTAGQITMQKWQFLTSKNDYEALLSARNKPFFQNHEIYFLTSWNIDFFFLQFYDISIVSIRNNILDFCVGWAWVIYNFLTMILGSQGLVFR